MLFPNVEGINASTTSMDDSIAQSGSQKIAAPFNEYWTTGSRDYLNAKLDSRRMIFIIAPNDVTHDPYVAYASSALK
jgi:hypothetical protein